MKIRKITYENSPIFGNIEFDFTDINGNAVNTIIIAGENGVGKSFLLNDIYGVAELSPKSFRHIEKKIFELEFSDQELFILKRDSSMSDLLTTNTLIITINSSFNDWKQVECKWKDSRTTLKPGFFRDPQYIRMLRTIFSDVEINFKASTISGITSLNIDDADIRGEKSGQNLATQITQLLVDIESLDSTDFANWGKNNIGKPVDRSKIDERMQRFTSAFDFMFPSKKYKRIATAKGKKDVLFEENGKEISINDLSSGEKQIVFRGGFLLKNKESSRGAVVLVDEPEISLHPIWQLKILNFIKKLFTDSSGGQTSQIFIATHSPFILHNTNRSDDKVIILQKEQNGQVIIAKDQKFYGWSPEQVIQEAFNITHLLSPSKTTVFLEGETDEKYYNKCLEAYDKLDIPFEFKWIGRINEKGQAEFSGDTSLNHVKSFFTANPEQIQHKVILFYDSDTSKPEENIGHLFIRQMQKNLQNTIFKAGVENLLVIDKDINIPAFYKETIKRDNYGAESIIRELNKTQLCNFICDNLNIEQQKYVLSKVNDEIERLIEDCR